MFDAFDGGVVSLKFDDNIYSPLSSLIQYTTVLWCYLLHDDAYRKASRQRLLLGDDTDQKATDQGAESDQDTG